MPSFYVPNEARIEVNGRVLLFCVIVSAVVGILSGLAPSLQSSRSSLVDALKDEGRGSSVSSGGRTRALLVIAEVALSVVLLVSASLTIRSFLALQKVDLGFQPERVMALGLPLPPKRYATLEQRNRFAQELLARIRNVPGVVAATLGNGGLPFGGPQSTFAIDNQASAEARRITLHAVSADYLRTLEVPLRQGRMLSEQEIISADRVGVINEAAVKLWPAGEYPVGRRIRLNELERPSRPDMLTPANPSPYITIVGVFGNMKNDFFQNEPQPAILVPYTLLVPPDRTVAVRSQNDPKPLMNALRAQVREMDSEQPLNGPFTFEEILGRRNAQPRFTMALFSLFAALGLALALAGIYSVLSYLVSMRTREIGMRMALGAQQSDIIRMILGMGGRLVGVGIVIGVLASFATARLLRSQVELFRVPTADPVSFLGVVVLLSVVAAAACFIPARRAAKVDPMIALRNE
jgi:predicted permease